jgi:spermidine synthase
LPESYWSRVYISLALTTMATLLLELSLTRIFSAVFYYHFAFLAISIALFGLGVGGVLSYVVASWRFELFAKLGCLSALNGVLIVVALAMVPAPKIDLTNWQLTRIYFVTALPFVVAGVIVSLVISETVERVNRVYFLDLLGAAGGCLLLVPLLNYVGGPGAVLAASVLFTAVAAIWFSMGPRAVIGTVLGVTLTLSLIVFLSLNTSRNYIGVKYGPHEIFVGWNSFSRVALENEEGGTPLIVIDGDAATSIWPINLDSLSERDRAGLLNTATGLPYLLRPRPKTLVIGPGGGPDVMHAVASGSGDITGVEINPLIATTIMREKFPQFSRSLYLRPEVHIVVEEGRSFVRRSAEKYDVIQATAVDTWAATAAGAFALSENNLYTSDAFRDYLEHLTDGGILAITRWGFATPRESLRLVSLAIDALHAMGKNEPWKHVVAVRDGDASKAAALDTVLISRDPFTLDDLARTEESIHEMGGVAILYLPNKEIPTPFTELLRSPNPREFARTYPFNISPVDDNRPFFFYTVQPHDLWDYVSKASHSSMDYKINRAVPLLFGLAGISIVATLIILALPPLVLGTRLPWRNGVLGFLMYFLFIGTGYILIEVALIQKFVLFLGHPTYALTVVIFSMLVTSGLGSYFSPRILAGDNRRWMKALALVAVLAAMLAFAVSYLLTPAVGLPLWLKIGITVLLIAPAGFVMGMPFPTGLMRLEGFHKPSLRWAWSLNAASSVLGSVAALVCAIYFGLLQTLLLGGALYLAALLVVARVGQASSLRAD